MEFESLFDRQDFEERLADAQSDMRGDCATCGGNLTWSDGESCYGCESASFAARTDWEVIEA